MTSYGDLDRDCKLSNDMGDDVYQVLNPEDGYATTTADGGQDCTALQRWAANVADEGRQPYVYLGLLHA